MRELNFDNKFKMRDPKETVSIITDFFSSKGYEVREETAMHVAYSDTWWHAIKLGKNGIFIAQSNGKGTTEDFSRASGYSELYERFCSKINWHRSNLLFEEFNKQSIEKLGYIDSKDEQLVDLAHFDINKYSVANNFNNMSLWSNIILGVGKLEECKYSKYNSDDCLYLNQKLLLDNIGSNGLAAGNTFEEAYVQAVSEIFERGVNAKLINHEVNSDELFYIINNNSKNISSRNKQIIETLAKHDITVIIFDFSFNYGVPVIGLLTSQNDIWRFTLGAQPDFNIALERCLTETCQGVSLPEELFTNYKPTNYIEGVTHPIYSKGIEEYIPERILLNNIHVDDINPNFWKITTTINEQIDFCNECADKNKLHLYYHDNSLCKNMYVISIYCPELANSIVLMTEKSTVINTNNSIINNNIKLTPKVSVEDGIKLNKINDRMAIFLKKLIANDSNLTYTMYPNFGQFENLAVVNTNLGFLKITWFSQLWSDLSFKSQSEILGILTNLNISDARALNKDYLFLYKYYLTQRYTDEQIEQLAKCHNTKFEKLNIYDRNKMIYNLLFSRVKEIIRLYIDEIIPDYIEYKREYDNV